jgi:metal-responsive CopG/Arc/MetJ family transcriptional regulator
MKKLIVLVALSPDVVTQLDSTRGKGVKISRSSLIENAVRIYLLHLEGSEAPSLTTKKRWLPKLPTLLS